MTKRDEDLQELMSAAAAAGPSSRIDYRDRIAAHGAAAIDRLAPWLADEKLGAFAVRVTERAAAYEALPEAVHALKRAIEIAAAPTVVADAIDALSRLTPRSAKASTPRSRRPQEPRVAPMAPEALVVGEIYRRRELHLQGLGGNWQSGISYPADGTYVLLFSNPDAGDEHGYLDRWSGDEYRYYGQWTGTGDMVFEVGNRAILDRPNELHLLIRAEGGHRYEGRFRLIRHEMARTVRDRREWQAIVFTLERYEVLDR